MSIQLLDKTRKLTGLLRNPSATEISFNEISAVMSEMMESNVLVLSRKGKVLGIKNHRKVNEIREMLADQVGVRIDSKLNERLLGVLSTKENVHLKTLGFSEETKEHLAMVAPIDIAGKRLGTLIIYKEKSSYDIEDIILCEYGVTVIGMEMMRAVNDEDAEENRKSQMVKAALKTLSVSEHEAMVCVFKELQWRDGLLVASKVAEQEGITRSVIVNGLKKLESAGVIEAKSAGMKGTRVRICNDMLVDELENL